jgi:hypothetical protein
MKEQISNPAPRAGRGRLVQTAREPQLGAVAPKLTKLFATKIVTPKPPPTDAATVQRDRLLAALLAAQGHSAITAAAEAFFAAGHALPNEQEYHLQILEHADEARVREALEALQALLAHEPARRRPVLEQRLHRLEDTADEAHTREAAANLRRNLR